MSRNKLLALASATLVTGVLLWRPSKRPPRKEEASSGYVDAAACSGCHQEIAKTYRLTGMGRSFSRPQSRNALEDYHTHNHFYHRASDRYYTMVERDGKYYQRRHRIGFDSQETNVVEKQIDFVIGSGNHARSYLHRTMEGKLAELPVSWYAEKGGYWAMSPGYDRPDQQDFRRTIGFDCMFCHNGYPVSEVGSPQIASEPVFGDRMPEGIDCQRCHGPGLAHITAAGAGRATGEAVRQAIVNPARLSRDRQLEICLQCHLETTSRQLPYAIPRFGRGPFAYRPGQPLGDYFLHFDRAPDTGIDDRFEIAHAAYRLRQSACFRASQMTCTTCHNPHQVPRSEEATGHYTAVCRSCHASIELPSHAPGAPAGTNCLDCHMPKRRAEDAVHVVMTDHHIQQRRPGRDLLAPLPEIEDGETSLSRRGRTLLSSATSQHTGE